MTYINYNGKLVPATTPIIHADNRSFRYGDGLFETIKYKEGTIILEQEHLDRLWKGMILMNFQIPPHFTKDAIKNNILQLIQKNKLTHARIRLVVFRGDGGMYDPINHLPHFVIQSWPLSTDSHLLNSNGLHMCIYDKAKKMADDFSTLKSNCYLPYFMAAMFAKKNLCNDALILNQFNRICDSTIANVFLICNNEIITPPLSEGCIAGIMRDAVINNLQKNGVSVKEETVSKECLLSADEIFVTNSILNIKWVGRIENQSYNNERIKELSFILQKTNPQVFC